MTKSFGQYRSVSGGLQPFVTPVPLTPDHHQVLDLLTQGQPVPEYLASVLEELVRWGWVMDGGELTGIGMVHVGGGSGGRVGVHDHPQRTPP